ncbi:putative phage cell wall peptidase, NlpC/P60 family [Loktanella fryxellensis]|uniref:Putative phage cell wall peptidase, NlpC/P60 family n=1 Tax=Loktanella fryxellensis TaxID=245187 RepID=A0A1H7YD85_9RHOB|nr:NlpC/P60 family protein [Loktanella fryxellensis]SEM43804.1 putative phage cell wall peptidase, NlpC/P60 family [Loktanella fryxellensis]
MSAVVVEALTWIGTPYVHQAATKGAGCDCLGLIRGIWRHLHGDEPQAMPRYTPDWDEVQGHDVLWAAARAHLRPVAGNLQPGQVLLFRMREGAVAKHLGVLSAGGDHPRFIHAYSRHGVLESPLSAPWARRIVARFDFQEG